MNSFLAGIHDADACIPSLAESPQRAAQLLFQYVHEFQPRNLVELRHVRTLWRMDIKLDRLALMEAGVAESLVRRCRKLALDAALHPEGTPYEYDAPDSRTSLSLRAGNALLTSLGIGNAFEQLSKLESRASQNYEKAYKLLCEARRSFDDLGFVNQIEHGKEDDR